MNKQQLASKIWESANKMRSKIEANEYKDYILGLIFYKFLSEKEINFLLSKNYTKDDIKNTVNENDKETVEFVRKNLGYFIAYDNLFSTWLDKGQDFNVGDVTDALAAFNRLIHKDYKSVYDKIFDTLQTGITKLGDSSGSRTKAISDLIHLIKDIPMDGRQDYDVLGFIYEYLISNFAANAGKKAGEFYTPHEVAVLMSEIVANHLKGQKEIEIYDPTSGSGSLLINMGRSVEKNLGEKDKIKYYAQELKENTYNLTRMNLIMRGIIPSNIMTRNGDTLEDDWPFFDESDPSGTYKFLSVDAVVSNPPYSQNWNPQNKEADPRYKSYGLAPKGKADYAFLLHDLYHVKPEGIMTIVLPHGVLFRGGEEGQIRKNLIENNKIDTIIGLPANIFFGTGIPTIIMVLKQKRSNTDVLVIDASKGFEKEGKNNKLRSSDIKRIVDTVVCRTDKEKFSKVVTREEIRNNQYNLNIPRYVDSSEKPESWDLYASMFGGIPETEVEELNIYWEAFPDLKEELFERTSDGCMNIKCESIREVIQNNKSVKQYIDSYSAAINDLPIYLYDELINKMELISIAKEENIIADNLFNRIKDIALVDRYDAYQIMDEKWKKIAIDLEIIQTEGFDACNVVDPNMVIKKKDGKETEVQDGWIGHIIPFDLIQKEMMPDRLAAIGEKERKLDEISSKYEELLESLTEDEKEKDFVNEDKTSFVAAEVKKAIKQNAEEERVLTILREYEKISSEEKKTKKDLKESLAKLQLDTKDMIEELSEAGVKRLLNVKWINSMTIDLGNVPENIIKQFINKIESLNNKYETTFSGLEDDINESEKKLSLMIDMLVGNDMDNKGLKELRSILGEERA